MFRTAAMTDVRMINVVRRKIVENFVRERRSMSDVTEVDSAGTNATTKTFLAGIMKYAKTLRR